MDTDQKPKVPRVPGVQIAYVSNQWRKCKHKWMRSPNKLLDHICILGYLVQPPISFINRRLRQVSLPVFYGVNRFHFEMANFKLFKDFYAFNILIEEERYVRDVKRSPPDWWRAVGNPNLSMLRHLTIIGKTYPSEDKYGGVVMTYRSDDGAQARQICGRETAHVEVEARQAVEERLRPWLDALSRDRPSIETLERVVSHLETCGATYLRERSMLEENRAEAGRWS